MEQFAGIRKHFVIMWGSLRSILSLNSTWEHFGVTWKRFGATWRSLEPLGGHFGAFWGHLEALCDHSGVTLAHFGVTWGSLWDTFDLQIM